MASSGPYLVTCGKHTKILKEVRNSDLKSSILELFKLQVLPGILQYYDNDFGEWVDVEEDQALEPKSKLRILEIEPEVAKESKSASSHVPDAQDGDDCASTTEDGKTTTLSADPPAAIVEDKDEGDKACELKR